MWHRWWQQTGYLAGSQFEEKGERAGAEPRPKSESGPSGVMWSESELPSKGGVLRCSVSPLAVFPNGCNDGHASLLLLLGLWRGGQGREEQKKRQEERKEKKEERNGKQKKERQVGREEEGERIHQSQLDMHLPESYDFVPQGQLTIIPHRMAVSKQTHTGKLLGSQMYMNAESSKFSGV